MPEMSRETMEQIIARGGSVMLGVPHSRIVSRVEDLPSGADLAIASGDTDARERAKLAARARADAAAAELKAIEESEAAEKTKAVVVEAKAGTSPVELPTTEATPRPKFESPPGKPDPKGK